MDMRSHISSVLAEQWIYALAVIVAVGTITLLYTVATPMHFGIW